MSAAVTSVVDRAEAHYRDLALAGVRRWKEATGGLAIGYLPIWAPREMLHAQGVLPVGLMGGGEDVEIIRGDAFYQSYICHLPRSTVELGLGGQLDPLDGLLFPAICDVIRNLSGVWQLQFPGKLVRYLDVPQNFDPEIGGHFLRQELESLAAELAERGARPLEAEALRASLAAYNANRARVRALYALREREPWKVPTWELYLIVRAGLVLPVEEFDRLLDDYAAAVTADEERRPMDQARVLVVGSFCEQPPLGLIKTLERSGCYIVDDDFVQIHRFLRSDIPLDGDPLANLVTAFLDDAVESPTRFCGTDRKAEAMVERTRACRAEGVVFCAPSFCDPALLDQPMAVEAVESIGVPWTAFKYAENTGQFQVIREQAGTFADSIKLWSNP
ncbi:MAG: benzoyl-CoA reductase subunit C [Thermoanaerobaculia bacterium]|jgi:benzoyl-CoA reductase subunit C|nr:MAG: benzoyl-CoA reductase subunit C [Thermoanaerobaculia bacterium]MBZ0101726.1 benzoyl-CoA reductase subunit C [Thermoanaerobaculia bacterium]